MKRVRFADALDEEGRHVHPKTRRPRTLLPGPEQGLNCANTLSII